MKPFTERLPSEEWIDARCEYIGGSQVSAVLGESEFETPLQVWLRKKDLIPPVETTGVMNFGNLFEDVIANFFEEETGFKTRKIAQTYTHKEHPFLRANIDRQILAGNGLESTAILEMKTTTSHRMKSLDWEPPRSWYLQCQHYLGILNYSTCYLQIYLRDDCQFMEPIKIERDDELIAYNMVKLAEWWETHMIVGKQPEPINGEDMLILYPDHCDGKVIEASPSIYGQYSELKKVRERKAELEAKEEHLKTTLKAELGEAERLVCAGSTLLTWKSTSQNRLDTTSIRKAHPNLYKQHLKETKTRRFTVH